MNPLIQGKFGTTPVMSRNAFNTNQGTNEDDSQGDPHPEAGIFGNQTMRKSGQKDRRDTVTGVTEQTRNGQKDRRDRHKNEYSPKSTRIFIFLKRAIFVINLGIYQYKSTFSTISVVIDSEIDNVNEFA